MLKSDAAAFLAGVTQVEGAAASAPTNLHVITGEVGTTSEEGKTTISIDGLVFSEEDSQEIEIDTLGGLEEGDIATVILTGESGHGMTPLAIGAPGSVDRLKARVVETELLIADKADIEDLEAATARIGDLEADHVSVNTLEAATARIETLEVDHVSVEDFEVEQANIDSLQAATADIDTIRANSAKVQNLTAAQLEADHATIGSLDTTYMHADMANADVAWINNGTIRDGAIVSAMINDVSANKLTAGTINGSVINVTNLNADNITAGTINGQRIGQGSLSLDKLSENVYTEAEVDTIVDGLNDRIDGAIETHTGTAVPTLNNSPASSWNTTALKDEHVGDVYYVVNSQSQQNGYCYRFTKSGSTYSWQLIKDSDVTAALSRLTTAEGKITSIESFDSTVSSFMTNTDSELTSVKSRASSLETRMTDAEGDISEKVDTSTFNTLSQTVDGNSALITSMSTVISNNGLTSSTNITNTVNTVSQTASGNSSKITQLTTTLGTNADGTTKAGDVVHRTSAIEQDLSGFKTTVSETYATKTAVDGIATRVSTAESNITQNANNIALKVSESDVTGNYIVGKINLDSTTASIAAQHINLQGAVTISDLASDAQNATLNSNISVGGRNLLRNTGNPTASDLAFTMATVEDGIITITPATYAGYAKFKVDYLDFDDYGEGQYTFSFDAKAVSGATYTQLKGPVAYAGFNVASRMSNASFSSSYDRYKSWTLSPTLTYDWTRYTQTFTVPDDLTTGQASALASGSNLTVVVAMTGSYAPMQVRNVKLERGNKATDWTPAPEDVTAYTDDAIDSIEVGGRNLLQDSKFTTAFNAGWWTLDGLSATLSDNKLVIDGSVAAAGNKRVYQPTSRFSHVTDTTYTFSCDIVATAACQVSFGRRYGTINQYGVTFNVTTTSQRLSGTYTATNTAAFCISEVSNSATVTISNPKLEIGNIATDWTPAPEDTPDQMTWYGTCSTEAASATKAVVCDGFELKTGTRLAVKFATANTANAPMLNVNGTGGMATWYNNAVSSSSNPIRWGANATLNFVYDGSVWVLDERPPSYTAACSTAAATRTKAASVVGALVVNGTRLSVRFSTANTYAASSVQVNLSSTGAYSVYQDNAVTSTTNTLLWNANTVLTFVAQGLYWFLLSRSDASKTATSYVTEITGQNGIMVHPSTDQTTGVQITDSVNIMQDGVSVAEYGETARVGAENSAHSVWESGEFIFNDGTNDTMKLSAPESITETHVIPSYSSVSYYAYIELEYPPVSLISVEVDNTEYTYTPTMTPYGLKLRKHEATFSGETVTVTYKPSPAMYIYDGVGDGSSNVATRINANKVSLAKDVFSISTAYDLSSGSIKGGDVRIGDSEASRSEIMLRYSSDRSYVTFQTTGGNRTAAFVLDTGTSSEPERSLDLIYLDKINYIDPYDNYKVLGRPTRLTANKSMTLTDTSGWTDGPSVDLTQGHWLVVGVAVFNTGSSSGVRKLRTQLRLGTSVYAEGTEINVANNAFGRVEAVAIMSASSDMTATLVLNSGMTFTTAATSYITAILLT